MSFKSTLYPETMYMYQAMKEEYKGEFKKSMQKDWGSKIKNGNFSIIKRYKVPKVATILPVVWKMRHKQDIKNRKFNRYKARLKAKLHCRVVEDNSEAL